MGDIVFSSTIVLERLQAVQHTPLKACQQYHTSLCQKQLFVSYALASDGIANIGTSGPMVLFTD